MHSFVFLFKISNNQMAPFNTKRKVQAQRKFAQGAHIPANNFTNSERRTERESNREEQRNVVCNNTTVNTLLDVISFQEIHKHKTPIVVLERLKTNPSIYPIMPIQQLEPVEELVENTSNKKLSDSLNDISSSTSNSSTNNSNKGAMCLRSHARNNDSNMDDIEQFDEPQDSKLRASRRRKIGGFPMKSRKRLGDSQLIISDRSRKTDNDYISHRPHYLHAKAHQEELRHIPGCSIPNRSDVPLDEDIPLAQYVRRKLLIQRKRRLSKIQIRKNNLLAKSMYVKRRTNELLQRNQRNTKNALLQSQRIKEREFCKKSLRDIAILQPKICLKRTNYENILEQGSISLPKKTHIEIIEITDDEDSGDTRASLPCHTPDSHDKISITTCPIINLDSFYDIMNASIDDIYNQCKECTQCKKFNKIIWLRIMTDNSIYNDSCNLHSSKIKFIRTMDCWNDSVVLDLDVLEKSSSFCLRICYCKNEKIAQTKPLLLCSLIPKLDANITSVESQYTKPILEYLEQHYSLFTNKSIDLETKNEWLCIQENRIHVMDKQLSSDSSDTSSLESNLKTQTLIVSRDAEKAIAPPEITNSEKNLPNYHFAMQSETVILKLTDDEENCMHINSQINKTCDLRQTFEAAVTVHKENDSVPVGSTSEDVSRPIPNLVGPKDLAHSGPLSISTPMNTVNKDCTRESKDKPLSPSNQRPSSSDEQHFTYSDENSLNGNAISFSRDRTFTKPKNAEDSLLSILNKLQFSDLEAPLIYEDDDPEEVAQSFDVPDITQCTGQTNIHQEPNSSQNILSCQSESPHVSVNVSSSNSRTQNENSTQFSNLTGNIHTVSSQSNKLPPPSSSLDSQTGQTTSAQIKLRPGQTILEAPIFRPTEEEFTDPVAYFDSIAPIASKYGICKVIPPSNIGSSCILNDEIKFTVTNQYIARLYSRWGPGSREMSAIKAYLASQCVHFKRAPLYEGMEMNLPKLYQIVQRHGGLKKVIERKRWNRVAEEIRFTKGPNPEKKLDQFYVKYLLPYDTLSSEERVQIMSNVERAWCEKSRKMTERAYAPLRKQKKMLSGSDSSSEEDEDSEDINMHVMAALNEAEECVIQGRKMTVTTFKKIASSALEAFFPNSNSRTVSEIEEDYWRQAMLGSEHICVFSASIDTGTAGYGFTSNKCEPGGSHPWNLKNLATSDANILRYLGPAIGVTVPTVHLGMVFSTSCWHRDPHGLPWMEYMHSGPAKIWYGIPENQSEMFRKAVEALCPTSSQNKTIWLPSDIAMIPPMLLHDQQVTLSRVEQNPGEYVIVFPKAYSCSICTGFTVTESVYFASSSWLPSALHLFQEAQASCEPTMFSLESMVLSLVTNASTPQAMLEPTQTVVDMLLSEEINWREALENEFQHVSNTTIVKYLKHAPGVWNVRDHDECYICRKSLFLSREAQASCEPTMFSLESMVLSLVTNASTPQAMLETTLTVVDMLLSEEINWREALENELQHVSNTTIVKVCGLTRNNTYVCVEHALGIVTTKIARNRPLPSFEIDCFLLMPNHVQF